MDILTNTYSAHDVAAAANVTPMTLQNWLRRGVVVGHGEDDIEGGGGRGRHRRFSFYAVMQISIAAALLEVNGGMEIKQAFYAAMKFAHAGHTTGGFVGVVAKDGEATRDPGHPFHFRYGKTLLATGGGKTAIVLHDGKGDAFDKIMAKLRPAKGFIVIDAGDVFDRVCSALGEHPNVVLDAAYPEATAD